MKINNGHRAYFLLSGTKDGYIDNDGRDNYYSLKTFNLLFAKNDINVLKEIFLYDKVDINNSGFYEYNRCADNISNRYGYFPAFLENQKNMDEILTSLTKIYTRLFNELDVSERVNVINKFIVFLTTLNIVNASLAQKHSSEYLSIVRYIDMFTHNTVLKDMLYRQVYTEMEKYNSESEEFIDPNVDHCDFKTRDYELVKEYDKQYVYLRDNKMLKPYINNEELSNEEQRKRFCDKYVEIKKETEKETEKEEK